MCSKTDTRKFQIWGQFLHGGDQAGWRIRASRHSLARGNATVALGNPPSRNVCERFAAGEFAKKPAKVPSFLPKASKVGGLG